MKKEKASVKCNDEVKEIMNLLKNMTCVEKAQLKGIMIGMQITREHMSQGA